MLKTETIVRLVKQYALFDEVQKLALLQKVDSCEPEVAIQIYKELKNGLNEYADLIDELYFISNNYKKELRAKYKEFGQVLKSKLVQLSAEEDENRSTSCTYK